MSFWDPTAGAMFLDGSSSVGLTGADQPQNAQASTDAPTNNLICDRTGFRIAVRDGLKREWTGRLVRVRSWEIRHPLDFVRIRPEQQKGSPRPEPDEIFLNANDVTAGSL